VDIKQLSSPTEELLSELKIDGEMPKRKENSTCSPKSGLSNNTTLGPLQ
jgi:hypothetical protein